jgi:hypothetical protein
VLLGLLASAAVVAALVPWLRRRLREPARVRASTWAQTMARRLDTEGDLRGRPRRRGETVPEYSAALMDSVLADPDLLAVGEVVSAGLFGAQEPPADAQAWAESVLERAVAANQPPSGPERRRARRVQPAGA